MKHYHKGNEQDYQKAVEFFEQALAADPTYSQAAFYLGLTYNALFDEEKAAAVLQESHRDRPRLPGGARQLRRHAAGYRRRR